MKLILSFIVSVLVYLGILFMLYKLFFTKEKPEDKKEVLVHTAVIVTPPKPKEFVEHIKKKEIVKKSLSNKDIKKGSQNDLTHGGKKVDFEDIFKNVSDNIKTSKVVQKEQSSVSRFKGVEEELSKIKKVSFNLNISYTQSKTSNLKKSEIKDLIEKKLSVIWNNISQIDGEYAKIHIVSMNGALFVDIINTNLPSYKQLRLISNIKKELFNKNFDITVYFKTKAKK